jgi:death on curing protein
MTDAPAFLSVEHVLVIHRRSIEEFGGDPSVRDQGLLESAVAMPAAQFGGAFLHDTVPAMAAAYLFHLCRNHPFVDGNKRTALASAEVFLLLNGMRFDARNDALEELTLGVAASRVSKEQTIAFFLSHAVPEDR